MKPFSALHHLAGQLSLALSPTAKMALFQTAINTSSCHRHGVDVFAYLHDILPRLAHDPQPALELLRAWLPDRWKPSPPAETNSS